MHRSRLQIAQPLACPMAMRLLAGPTLSRRLISTAAGNVSSRLREARGASLRARQDLASSLSSHWTAGPAGEPTPTDGAGMSLAFSLVVDDEQIGSLRAALWPGGTRDSAEVTTALIFALQVDPALPLADAGPPLVRAARVALQGAQMGVHPTTSGLLPARPLPALCPLPAIAHQNLMRSRARNPVAAGRGAERVLAVAPLRGLCDFIVTGERWSHLDPHAEDYDDEQPAAVEAVARGVPRPGHSAVGGGTFAAAKPAFERLGREYARLLLREPDSECAAYHAAGGELTAINYMHASDAAALRDHAGVTVSFELPSAADFSIRHD